MAVDVAVMLADGGEAISDIAVLRDQAELFGVVASDATAWRVLDAIDHAAIERLEPARAAARELAWAQRNPRRWASPCPFGHPQLDVGGSSCYRNSPRRMSNCAISV